MSIVQDGCRRLTIGLVARFQDHCWISIRTTSVEYAPDSSLLISRLASPVQRQGAIVQYRLTLSVSFGDPARMAIQVWGFEACCSLLSVGNGVQLLKLSPIYVVSGWLQIYLLLIP